MAQRMEALPPDIVAMLLDAYAPGEALPPAALKARVIERIAAAARAQPESGEAA